MKGVAVLMISGWLWPFGGGPDRDETIKALDREAVEISEEQAIDNSSELARQNYRMFLELVGDDPNLGPEAMRRLADLELEATEAAELGENMQAVMLSSNYGGAVELYENLLARYPDYGRNDLVLYQLARAHESSGNIEAALETLDRLVSTNPDTVHFEEAQFRRGEMLFVRRDYDGAKVAYSTLVRDFPEGNFYLQSLYKLGWSQFKLAEHEDSLDPFFSLLALRLEGSDEDGTLRFTPNARRADRELVEDTLRVLSISFSYMEGPESIDDFFDSVGTPEYAYLIYANLGSLYVDKERYEDAAGAFLAFVEREPLHPRSPLLEMAVIESWKQAGFPTRVLDAKQAFVERYGMDTAFWQQNDAAELPNVVAALKTNLTDLAQFYHARAQNPEPIVAQVEEAEKQTRIARQVRDDYRAAARWYRKYLAFFPGEPDSAGTNFLLAEILFESEAFGEATDEYERTAYDYGLHAQDAEAGYAALLAYAAQEETLPAEARADWHERSLTSSLRFADTFPDHPEVAAVMTATAEDLFGQSRFEEAITVAGRVTALPAVADPELERSAWTVVAHSQFDLGRFGKAEQSYYQLQARTPVEDLETGREIGERIASSIYKQAEISRDVGDLEAAVGHFLRIATVVPESPIVETAEYDAAAALISMGQWARATPVLEAFRSRYPESEFADDVSRSLAAGYLETGDSLAAASEFERISDDLAMSPAEREEALWQAAGLYKDTGMIAEERGALERIITRYPAPFDPALEARFRLSEIASQTGDAAARRQWLEDIVTVDGNAGAARTDRSRYLAATATLELTEPLRQSFAQMRITAPLKESLGRKRALMEQVLAEYGRAADYGVSEVTTASTYRIAELYQVFSADLMNSERPADLDELALEQYDILLEEQAFPFEEQAIDIYAANAARAAEGIYDEWVQKSFDALADLMPARYAKAERSDPFLALLE